MPALLDVQRSFAGLLLGDADAGSLAGCADEGRIPLRHRLAVHRNTVCGGLCHALRLRYPAVAHVLGGARFERTALAYAATDWPCAPQLDAWGDGFASFLESHAPLAHLSCLGDLGRFDALLAALGARAQDAAQEQWPWHRLNADFELAIAPSLQVLTVAHEVDAIRTALLDGTDPAPALDTRTQAPLHLVAWRDGATLRTRRIGAAALRFLRSWLADEPGVDALAAAMRCVAAAPAEVVTGIQQEILGAPFAALRAVSAAAP